jgi:hypothetical protein
LYGSFWSGCVWYFEICGRNMARHHLTVKTVSTFSMRTVSYHNMQTERILIFNTSVLMISWHITDFFFDSRWVCSVCQSIPGTYRRSDKTEASCIDCKKAKLTALSDALASS